MTVLKLLDTTQTRAAMLQIRIGFDFELTFGHCVFRNLLILANFSQSLHSVIESHIGLGFMVSGTVVQRVLFLLKEKAKKQEAIDRSRGAQLASWESSLLWASVWSGNTSALWSSVLEGHSGATLLLLQHGHSDAKMAWERGKICRPQPEP